MTNVFEQPWLLLGVSAVALLVVFIINSVSAKGAKWWLWLLPILIAASAFAVDYFVATDNEKVKTVIARIVRAVQNENADAMEPFISQDYHDSYHPSKEALLDNCRDRLSEPLIEKNVLSILSTDVKPPNASVVFTVRVVFDPKGYVYEFRKMMIFKLQAQLRKQGENWFLSRIEIVTIDLQPADWQHIQGAASEVLD